jgi:hypothetical protein
MELLLLADNSGGGGFLPDLLSFLYDAANIASLGLLKLGVFLGSELWDAISSLWESESAPQTFSFEFPIDLSGFGLNGDFIVSAMLGFEASLASVVINEGGLTAVLDASVMPTNLDPDIPEIPGIVATPAEVPTTTPDTPSARGVFAIADDTVDALLAALTAQGEFKSVCSEGTSIRTSSRRLLRAQGRRLLQRCRGRRTGIEIRLATR